jgi:hypothetical protein
VRPRRAALAGGIERVLSKRRSAVLRLGVLVAQLRRMREPVGELADMTFVRRSTNRRRGWPTPLALVAASLLASASAKAQQAVGHKVLGTAGLRAGSQVSPGVSFVDQFVVYSARRLVDPRGDTLPVGLRLEAYSEVLGIVGTYELPGLATYVSGALGVPMASVSLNSRRPDASIDLFGLGDLYVQPLLLGWHLPRVDVTVGYAFYAPTARYEPGGTDGVGSAQWTHEASLGGTLILDRHKTWSLSALASYQVNQRKLDADVTRGQSVQVQGGLGARVRPYLDVGLAGYGFWQVTPDSGADLPRVLRGLRDTAYGAGPELDITIAAIRGQVSLRYEHDLVVRARPHGQVFVIQLAIAAWTPG